MKLVVSTLVGVAFAFTLFGCGGAARRAEEPKVAADSDLEARLARLESAMQSMEKDLATWRTFLQSFQQGVQKARSGQNSPGSMKRGGNSTFSVGDTVVEVTEIVVVEVAEQLGTLVGEYEAAHPPAEKPKPEKPENTNEATSGQQGHAGHR